VRRRAHRSGAARLTAWLGLLVWVGASWAAALPWADLGGLVGERLRWLHRSTAWTAPWLGYCVAGAVRRRLGSAGPAAGLRWLLYPAVGVGAVGLILFEAAGREDEAGVLLAALLGFGSGVWARYVNRLGRPDGPQPGESEEAGWGETGCMDAAPTRRGRPKGWPWERRRRRLHAPWGGAGVPRSQREGRVERE
jgi:hypothetical protein